MLFSESLPFLLVTALAARPPDAHPLFKAGATTCLYKAVVCVRICESCLPVPQDVSSGPPRYFPCKQDVLLDVRLSPCTRTGIGLSGPSGVDDSRLPALSIVG